MKKIFNIFSLIAVSAALLCGCKGELVDTNQYAEAGVALNVYGPQPVMRGGELRFLGSNLDKITEVIIPGVSPITDINVVKAGVPSEIRIIVPKDGPEPGVVTLVAADGKEIVTKTALTYLEPIELESFSPASVKADDVLTIKGDYLNLIHEVIFSEDVIVSEKAFISHSRYEIKVKVPVEARTGVIGVGDIDETLEENADLIPNIIYSEDELAVAQPEVTSMTAARFIANASVKISGRNLNYVAALNLPGAPATEFTVNAAGTEIIFDLPATAQDGTVILVAKSGVEVEAGEYETVVPTSLVAAPSPVKAGAILTISGDDLNLVTGVDLPGAAGIDYETAESITLTMPDTATEGDATLRMANGKSVTVAFTLVKPVFEAFSENPAAAGSDIVISGTDLDLVKSVTFGGNLTVEVEAAETEITVAVPTTAETGMVKLNLANGTSVDCESLTVNKPTACFITELPSAETEIYGGTVLVVPVENEDKLESVEVNGESVKFLLNGKTLYINLPDMAGKGTVVKLISSNGAVEYTIDCIPNNIQKKVIWSGSWDCGSWSGNQDLAWGGFDWSSVDLSAGTVTMIFDFTQDSSQGWWQLALRHGDGWADLPENSFFELAAGQSQLEVPLTQAMLDDLIANGGLVLTGCNYTLTKITLKTEIPMDVTLWEGEAIADDWKNQPSLLSDGGTELVANGAKAGSKVSLYITPLEADWKLEIVEGHWGPTYASICSVGNDTEDGKFTEYDLAANGGCYTFELTQEMYDNAIKTGGWGGVFVLNGDNVKVTKVTLLP
ncbi:MAG: polygalacturonase [Bacteroidales bacterium]|nr:polygalacturonase [Bacteroidales bacterium]MDY2860159.1 polygalacturonase [Candidatus Cryptobacteroides sp.]MDY5442725.1 polygalacturonase [Candidatus Cryptobacteroides sp.]